MQQMLIEKQESLEDLCRHHHVRQLTLFGSALREDFDPVHSDLDMLVDFFPLSPEEYAENYFALSADLTQLFSRRVDLIAARAVRNPYLKREIEANRKTLYAA